MQKPFLNRDSGLALFATILCAITIFLLLSTHYFSLKDLDDTHVSLRGMEIEGNFYNFDDLMETCDISSPLSQYCSNLPDLKKGGRALLSMLIIDALVLAIFIFETIFLNCILKKLVRQVLLQKEISRLNKCLSKFMASGKFIIYLHPVVLFSGVVLWVCISDLESFQNDIRLEEGIIVFIIQSFLSLLLVAFYSLNMSITKRHNLRFMLKQDQKNFDDSQDKSADLTLSM